MLTLEDNVAICKEWVEWHDSEMAAREPVSALQKRISEKYNIHEDYIYQILKKNASLLKHNAEWRKFLRICKLQREQAKKNGTRKDLLDIMAEERKELEGDKPLIDQSQHITVNVAKYDREGLQTARRAMGSI